MLLIEKVQELQAIQPPLDPTEIKRRIEIISIYRA
jgi:hypothetical protein